MRSYDSHDSDDEPDYDIPKEDRNKKRPPKQ